MDATTDVILGATQTRFSAFPPPLQDPCSFLYPCKLCAAVQCSHPQLSTPAGQTDPHLLNTNTHFKLPKYHLTVLEDLGVETQALWQLQHQSILQQFKTILLFLPMMQSQMLRPFQMSTMSLVIKMLL